MAAPRPLVLPSSRTFRERAQAHAGAETKRHRALEPRHRLAVSAGVADMYHSYDGYFLKNSPALNFYCGVPFGFTADELFAWVQYGGGQELWDALSGQFNIKPLLC